MSHPLPSQPKCLTLDLNQLSSNVLHWPERKKGLEEKQVNLTKLNSYSAQETLHRGVLFLLETVKEVVCEGSISIFEDNIL